MKGPIRALTLPEAKALYLTHLPVRHEPGTLAREAQAVYPAARAVWPGMVIEL